MLSRKPAFLLGLLLLPCTLVAQQTFVVDVNGGGDFTQIQPAVDAAQAGDIVRVRHGEYLPVTISKGIRLLGDPRGPEGDDIAYINASWTVSDLPRSEIFVATDIRSRFLSLTESQGSIFLSRLTAGMTITDCDQVSLHRCEAVNVWGRVGAMIVDSRVLDVRGRFAGIGGNGLVLERAQMTLVNSTVLGSVPGTTAAILTDSNVVLSVGTRVWGGPSRLGGSGPAFQLRGDNSATFAAHALIVEESVSLDTLFLEIETGYTMPHLLVAGSLASRPVKVWEGTFFLDHESIQLIFQGVSSIGQSREKRVALPMGYSPNIHRRGTYPDRSAPAGSRWLGIPVTFQALVTDRNGNRSLSLPYTIVF